VTSSQATGTTSSMRRKQSALGMCRIVAQG
jgi:hypothetical protein